MSISPRQKSNIATVAIRLLQTSPPPNFRMRRWSTDKKGNNLSPYRTKAEANECGTSCCFAGHGPVFLPETVRKREGWLNYARRVFVPAHSHRGGEFLFAAFWPNNKKQAARRALVFLELGSPWEFNHQRSRYLTRASDEEVIRRLSKFLIEPLLPLGVTPKPKPLYIEADNYWKS